MDTQIDDFLLYLEREGVHIADCRKKLSDLILSGDKIDTDLMLSLCNKLNDHISSFDQINEQLIALENSCSP